MVLEKVSEKALEKALEKASEKASEMVSGLAALREQVKAFALESVLDSSSVSALGQLWALQLVIPLAMPAGVVPPHCSRESMGQRMLP